MHQVAAMVIILVVLIQIVRPKLNVYKNKLNNKTWYQKPDRRRRLKKKEF
jgi:hypothetical protein